MYVFVSYWSIVLIVTMCTPDLLKLRVIVPSIGLYLAAPCSSDVTVMNASFAGLSTSVSIAMRLIVRCVSIFRVISSRPVRSRRGASLTGFTLMRRSWSANCSPSLARSVTRTSPLTSSSTVSKTTFVPSRDTSNTSLFERPTISS